MPVLPSTNASGIHRPQYTTSDDILHSSTLRHVDSVTSLETAPCHTVKVTGIRAQHWRSILSDVCTYRSLRLPAPSTLRQQRCQPNTPGYSESIDLPRPQSNGKILGKGPGHRHHPSAQPRRTAVRSQRLAVTRSKPIEPARQHRGHTPRLSTASNYLQRLSTSQCADVHGTAAAAAAHQSVAPASRAQHAAECHERHINAGSRRRQQINNIGVIDSALTNSRISTAQNGGQPPND